MSDPAELPNGAPRALRRFVRCEVDEATLDLTDAAWLNEIPMISGATTTAKTGSTPNSGTITFDAEWTPAFDLEVLIVDGELVASVAGPVGQVANGPIKDWTDALNKTLKANDKQLRDLHIDGSALRLRKQPIPPPVDEPAPATPPVVEVPTPTPEPGGPGCLPKILAGATAVAIALGIFAATRDGGDNESATGDSVATEAAPPDVAAEVPSSSTTSTTSTTTTTTTTIAQVGQIIEDDAEQDEGLVACGDLSDPASVEPYGVGEVPSGPCELIASPSGFAAKCQSAQPYCNVLGAPGFAVVGSAGVAHGQGESTAIEQMRVWYSEGGPSAPQRVRATWDCAGTITSGEAELGSDGEATVEMPLQFYGPCTIEPIELIGGDLDGHLLIGAGPSEHIVDESEPASGVPDAELFVRSSDRFDIDPGWSDDLSIVNQTIAGDAVDSRCTWIFSAENFEDLLRVIDGCPDPSNFWAFAAARNDLGADLFNADVAIAMAATFVDPPGDAPGDTGAFALLFDNTVFPCGFGHVAYTACAEGDPVMNATGLITVGAAMVDPVPIIGDGSDRSHTVDFSANGGPTYTIRQLDEGWVTESSIGPSRARTLIRGNSITLVVPDDELQRDGLTYSWSTAVDGQTTTQPPVPVVGRLTVPTIPAGADAADPVDADSAEPVGEDSPIDEAPPGPTESLADFYTQLSASVSAGDLGFAIDRLDQRVFEVYPDSCPAALESFADPDLVIEFVSAGPVEDWVYEANEQSVGVPGSQAVTIRLSGRGQSAEESVAHLSLIDGQYRWFTFC